MLSTIEKQLNESQRDALITGYLKFVVTNLKDEKGKNLGDRQVTVEDLYEYLLIDPKVGDEVQTSRVAQAIASVQEYMTRIVNGAEPGLQANSRTVNAWRDNESQYSLWAAGIDVKNYPENYISPTSRLEKSHYFKDLETTLNQNQLDPGRVQNAVLAYLNEFEAVSNLYILSGYINPDFSGETPSYYSGETTYYFIGRTTTKPYQYYWRQMDLSKNGSDYANRAVLPDCWSDWQKINLPLSSDMVLEHTVRPVFYNNRLYVTWVERDPTQLKDADGKIPKDDDGKSTNQHAYSVRFGYKRYDDSWTAPNSTVLMKMGEDGKEQEIGNSLTINEADSKNPPQAVNLLATVDFSMDSDKESDEPVDSNPYGRLMLGVFVRNSGATNAPHIYGYQYCDSAFNHCTLGELTRELLFASFVDQYNPTGFVDQNNTTSTLQLPVYDKRYAITGVEKETDEDPENTGWNSKIAELQKVDTGESYVYITNQRNLRVEMRLSDSFTNDYVFTEDDQGKDGDSGFGFCRSDDAWDVTIRYHDGDYYTFEKDTVLQYEPNLFGQGSIAGGDYHIDGDIGENHYTNILGDVTIGLGNYIGWRNELRDRNLKLTGFRLLEGNNVINYGIKNNKLHWGMWGDSYGATPCAYGSTIKNFGRIGDTRRFFLSTEIRGSAGGGAEKDDLHYSYELNQGDVQLTKDITLKESLFANSKSYLNVCLKVKWDHFDRPTGNQGDRSWVCKWFKVFVEMKNLNMLEAIPCLKSRYDSQRGLVQYLDFGTGKVPKKTRLNTTFVRTLIKEASLGLDSLLNYSLQTEKLEADLTKDGESKKMDFYGANGLYFWELFFHLPFLVATRFASEQQFDPAQRWLHYIFDPARPKKGDVPAYWNVRALVDRKGDVSRSVNAPLDPDAQAYAHPEVYQKAVFIAYVRNLIAQGDAWYRQLTRDGLTQARVYYNFAAELLGSRPDVSISSNWQARSLGKLAKKKPIENSAIRQFEHKLDPAVLLALPGRYMSYLSLVDNPYFTEPLNTLMLSHWDMLEARLYNLRHNLTVDGKPLSLPLYAAPADPVALLSQRAQAGTLSAGVSGAMRIVPPYRFSAMLPRAYNAVATLSRFGETLLSLLERSERAGQEELAQQQLLDMSSYAITLQQQAIEGLVADRAALQASQATAQLRYERYYALYQENISDAERKVMDTHTLAQSYFAGAQGFHTASGALKELPNIFGFSDGGSRYEGVTEAVGGMMQLEGQVATLIAERLATAEGYRRRRQDWQIQYEQAQAEVNALAKQLDALAIREKAARTTLQQAQAQQAQVQVMLTYLKSRFTQATLYQWLSGQLAAQYYQAYDAVVSLCLSTQACWQYELGDFSTTFIQTGTWNDHYRGLQVGETLQLNLHQMEAAYLARHERRLEITRTVSLKDLLDDFDTNKGNGCFEFDLKEELFDRDYPGHYLRQIKSVSITLPTSLGPYQDVKATLTQTKSSTLLQADLSGVNYLITDGKKGTAHAIITNLRASQQIALSSGLNDAGQFELNFSDERYLPFEGTGAVSSWVLKFPRPDKLPQSDLLARLDNVIVHVRYTALDGGESFAQDVEKLLS
jgi:hypothetical protein